MLGFAKLGDFSACSGLRLSLPQLPWSIELVIGCSKNLWTSIDTKIRAYLSVIDLMYYKDMESIVRGHLEILQALQAGDEQRLGGLMEEHIDEMLKPLY